MLLLRKLISFFSTRHKRREDTIVCGVMRSMSVETQSCVKTQEQVSYTPDNDILLRFFRNEDAPQIPHRHENIVVFDDSQMEMYHDFIQWIFPTKQQSRMHPEAPIIDDRFAEQLCADECANKNFCKSCQRYLNYMNFDCEGDCHIVESTREIPFYKLPYHNFLRITRMLDSLNQTGHQACSMAVYEKMFEVLRTASQHWIHTDTLRYWKATQQRPMREIIFLDFDGVMCNGRYDLHLNKFNLPEKDEFGVVFDPDCVSALKLIIDSVGAEIVISSDWKIDMTMKELQSMWLKRQLPGKVIDRTPSISRYRGDEVQCWLDLCPDPCRYVIIDDLPPEQFHTDHYEHLITTDDYDGLTIPLAKKSIQILNQ